MPKKSIVKVVLSKEQKQILESLTKRLGLSQSELLTTAFMEYPKSIGATSELVTQRNFPKL